MYRRRVDGSGRHAEMQKRSLGDFRGSEISPFPASLQGWANAPVGICGAKERPVTCEWEAGTAGGPRLPRLRTVSFEFLYSGILRATQRYL